MNDRIRRALFVASLGMTALVAAEVAARLDDWIRLGIPFTRTPDYDHDLKFRDWFGVRGRPHGRYQRWQLNNFGFRGPDMAASKAPGCTRVLVFGASETFGLFESPGHEYPAQLRDSLARHGCYEVVNSAIVGSGLRNTVRLWEHYAWQFHPDVVVIYPSPTFYLNPVKREWPPVPGKAESPTVLAPRPRLIDQFHSAWETPDFLQRWRLERSIAAETAGKPEGWLYATPPEAQLDIFMSDLDSLVRSIRARGARPVLMTHAMRMSVPPVPEDEMLLLGWRKLNPRATTRTILGFETEAADRMRAYAVREKVDLVDAARVMSGHKDLFADFVHFTDRGAGEIAGLVSQHLVTQPRAQDVLALPAPPETPPVERPQIPGARETVRRQREQ